MVTSQNAIRSRNKKSSILHSQSTPPKINKPKNDGWKTSLSPFGKVTFQGLCSTSGEFLLFWKLLSRSLSLCPACWASTPDISDKKGLEGTKKALSMELIHLPKVDLWEKVMLVYKRYISTVIFEGEIFLILRVMILFVASYPSNGWLKCSCYNSSLPWHLYQKGLFYFCLQ